jgi:hypothetical protein
MICCDCNYSYLAGIERTYLPDENSRNENAAAILRVFYGLKSRVTVQTIFSGKVEVHCGEHPAVIIVADCLLREHDFVPVLCADRVHGLSFADERADDSIKTQYLPCLGFVFLCRRTVIMS